jgi:hypothetical protein
MYEEVRTDRASPGFFEGSLVCVLSLLLMAWVASSGISTAASGAFRIVRPHDSARQPRPCSRKAASISTSPSPAPFSIACADLCCRSGSGPISLGSMLGLNG